MKFLRMSLGVLLLVTINGCITQEDTHFGDSKTELIQPELSNEGFIDLINSILLEKVSLEMFDVYNGSLMYIRNTFDCNDTEIRVVMKRSATDVYISVNPGHFGKLSGFLEMIDTRGLFTPQIESQGDLTPPSNFKKTREYNIEVMDYKGSLGVSRGQVSIYFVNIGGLSPTPTHPDPTGNAIYYVYGGFFVLIFTIAVLCMIVWRRRRKP